LGWSTAIAAAGEELDEWIEFIAGPLERTAMRHDDERQRLRLAAPRQGEIGADREPVAGRVADRLHGREPALVQAFIRRGERLHPLRLAVEDIIDARIVGGARPDEGGVAVAAQVQDPVHLAG
jgi:hypothetical protein